MHALPCARKALLFRLTILIQPLRLVRFLPVDGTMYSSDIRNDATGAGRPAARPSYVLHNAVGHGLLLSGALFGC